MSFPHLSHPKYRRDIDGLRAVAVLSVVAFHAFPEWIKGGFIGVDVFFVISGYLISTIIYENLDNGTFSFTGFYLRRVKRIFPALLIVLVSCYAFGWFSLLGDEYMQLGKHIAGGASFASNLVLWSESGYFDNAAETKPLLHLWSLGVEEQFYIFWPLLLWFAYRRRLNLLGIGILVALVSFGLNLRQVKVDAVADFYSPQTRFWELMLGSILAWLTLYKPNFRAADARRAGAMSVAAALLLAFGFWHIDKRLGFPGKWALIPVLSAAMLILAGPGAWVNRVILSNRIAVWIGLISFPLYLWHWPLLTYARIIHSKVPAAPVRGAIVLVSFVLAWLTYRLVERPVRLGSGGARLKVAALVVLMPVVGVVGYNTFVRHGLAFRDVVKINTSIATGNDGGPGVKLVHDCGLSEIDKALFFGCFKDPRGPVKYALLGDSKAGALWPGVVRTSSAAGRWLLIGDNGPAGGSVPILSDNRIFSPYRAAAGTMVNGAVANPDIRVVVIATSARAMFSLEHDYDIEDLPANNNRDAVAAGLHHTVEKIVRAHKKVVLVVDNPTLAHPEDCLGRVTSIPVVNKLLVVENEKCRIPLERQLQLSTKYRSVLEEVRAAFPDDVALFETAKYLCDDVTGYCGMRKDGRFLYGHTDHISDYAAGLIGKDLNQFLDAAWPSTQSISRAER
ncbi:Peptidoglycan/LPS O-acetylase OafA/YrhL, contains acyltransferase and SGNH-hydrolase domains [Massilia sp. PDC64]|nr:acyltransferase family protein [Massilia sp. PDC64]SDD98707.1 Peptidoglycan/LPS O-acetylase OafA/YrhL, contains acyltransferase and SGNH-hydrolase domains [Massilia sp. PDC64]